MALLVGQFVRQAAWADEMLSFIGSELHVGIGICSVYVGSNFRVLARVLGLLLCPYQQSAELWLSVWAGGAAAIPYVSALPSHHGSMSFCRTFINGVRVGPASWAFGLLRPKKD